MRLTEQSTEGQSQEMVNPGKRSRSQLIHCPSLLGNRPLRAAFPDLPLAPQSWTVTASNLPGDGGWELKAGQEGMKGDGEKEPLGSSFWGIENGARPKRVCHLIRLWQLQE